MDKPPVSLKTLFVIAAIALIFLLFSFLSLANDTSTKVVFCDIGQGDAAYIRIKNQIDILIDAGPDRKVLDCLSKYMPFFDRKIEIAFLTHPHYDHYGGFLKVIDHYAIERFIETPFRSEAGSYLALQGKLKSKNVLVQNLYAGDSINLLGAQIKFLWPDVSFVSRSPKLLQDPNSGSQMFLFSLSNFDILFTGDREMNSELIKRVNVDLEILKIPHHGSRDGINSDFLSLSRPEIAVISVGKRNSYGHPSKQTLDLLQSAKIQILRTDEKGHILFNLGK